MKKLIALLVPMTLGTSGAAFAAAHMDAFALSGEPEIGVQYALNDNISEGDSYARGSLPNVEGIGEAGMFFGEFGSEAYGYFDLSTKLDEGSIGIPFSVKIGLEGIVREGGSDLKFTIAAQTRINAGELELGIVDPALDRYFETPTYAGNYLTVYYLGTAAGLGRSLTNDIMADSLAVGAALQLQIGKGRAGASVHYFPENGDFTATAAYRAEVSDTLRYAVGVET